MDDYLSSAQVDGHLVFPPFGSRTSLKEALVYRGFYDTRCLHNCFAKDLNVCNKLGKTICVCRTSSTLFYFRKSEWIYIDKYTKMATCQTCRSTIFYDEVLNNKMSFKMDNFLIVMYK